MEKVILLNSISNLMAGFLSDSDLYRIRSEMMNYNMWYAEAINVIVLNQGI